MRNLAASVRQRLLNRARSEQRPFQELLQLYAMERFLYRLSHSALADRFILKGALMLQVWEAPQSRPTGSFSGHSEQCKSVLATLCAVACGPFAVEWPGSEKDRLGRKPDNGHEPLTEEALI